MSYQIDIQSWSGKVREIARWLLDQRRLWAHGNDAYMLGRELFPAAIKAGFFLSTRQADEAQNMIMHAVLRLRRADRIRRGLVRPGSPKPDWPPFRSSCRPKLSTREWALTQIPQRDRLIGETLKLGDGRFNTRLGEAWRIVRHLIERGLVVQIADKKDLTVPSSKKPEPGVYCGVSSEAEDFGLASLDDTISGAVCHAALRIYGVLER